MGTVTKYANKHTAITTGYTNPTNAYATGDSAYATAAPAKQTEVSAYWGFPAFSTSDIPDGSNITSVTAEIKFKVDTTASIANQYLQLFLNTTGQGSEQGNTAEPATDTALTHQVTTGITLTNLRTADIVRAHTRSARGNDNDAVTFSIEYVKLTVVFDAPPTVVLGAPADTATNVSLTPELKFTGTDTEGQTLEYTLELDTANTFDSGSTPNQTVANYPITNRDDLFICANIAGERKKVGQTFKPSSTCTLTKVQLFLEKTGNPTGNANVKMYAHTGTFGSGGVPTGAALDTSANFDVSQLTTTEYALYDFTFSGGISLTAGTAYCAVFEYDGGSSSNWVKVGVDYVGSTYEGNEVVMMYGDTAWSSDGDVDVIFYVIGTTGGPTLSKKSDVDTGFTAGHPFASGSEITYTVPASILSNSTQYFWRVKAKDPSGTNSYGPWATVKSFTTLAGSGSATVIVNTQSYVFSGKTVNFRIGRKFSVNTQTYSISAKTVNFSVTRHKIFQVTKAEFLISTKTVGITKQFKRAVNTQSYSITAKTVNFSIKRNYSFQITKAEYVITAKTVNYSIQRNYTAQVSKATYTITPKTVNFNVTRHYTTQVTKAEFVITPKTVNVRVGKKFTINPAQYLINAKAVQTTVQYKRAITANSYTFEGKTVNFSVQRNYKFQVTKVEFTITAKTVNTQVLRNYKFQVNKAEYVFSGKTVNFSKTGNYTVQVNAGTYAFTPNTVNFKIGRKFQVSKQTYDITAKTVNFSIQRNYKFQITKAEYVIETKTVIVSKTGNNSIQVTPAQFTITCGTVNVTIQRKVQVQAAQYLITANTANFRIGRKFSITPAAYLIEPKTVQTRKALKRAVTAAHYDFTTFTLVFSIVVAGAVEHRIKVFSGGIWKNVSIKYYSEESFKEGKVKLFHNGEWQEI